MRAPDERDYAVVAFAILAVLFWLVIGGYL